MGFQQGLSGLNAASKSLEAIGNNVANTGTVGFKGAVTQFADVFASSLTGGGAGQVGIGTKVERVNQQFTQGNISVSSNPLDIAINGGGFYRMTNNGVISYTRNGQFQLDKSGYMVNGAGLQLTGYIADATGQIVQGNFAPIQINNAAIAPKATEKSQIQVNLDSRSNSPAKMSHGTSTGSVAPTFAVPLVAGVGDSFSATVDGVGPVAVTIPPGTYSTSGQLASAMTTAINAALGGVNPQVDVSVNASGRLVVTSRSAGSIGSQGSGSTVVLADDGISTGYTNFFGVPTTTVGADNFSIADSTSYNSATAQTVYDSLGNPHTMQLYFAKTGLSGQWQLYTSLDGSVPTGATNVNFNTSGVLTTVMPLTQSFILANGASSPLEFEMDLTGTTQYGISFGASQLLQDGFTSGKLAGLTVSSDGIVQGRYSNGETRNMGQVILASFNNPNGLQSLGGNQWAETSISGQPIPGLPGGGNLGVLQSGANEESNVDMTAELVNMITQQRSYQANAQTIKTIDQILQTLVNLR